MKKISIFILTATMLVSLGCCIYQAAAIFFGWIPAGKLEVAAGLFQLFMSDIIFLFIAVALKLIPKDETI